ncbi:MAG: T9SS type A sorting domain-containing protein, partial [Clostridia bacterium]|nr:T9SS type A sorting domain-containing protein [Clostridia bacterium]
ALQQATAPAATYARNVLVMLHQTEYDEPIQIPDLFKSTSAEVQYRNVLSSTAPSVLEVYPNPAKDYVMIKYAADEQSSKRTLEIRNLKGELIREVPMTQAENTITVITRGWNAGTYVVSLAINGKTTESTKFTIIQ